MEELNDFVHDLMSTQDAKEGERDQVEWYKPRAASLKEFMDEVTKWTADSPVYNVSEEKDVKFTSQDSACVQNLHSKGSKRPSQSSIASAKLKLEGQNGTCSHADTETSSGKGRSYPKS